MPFPRVAPHSGGSGVVDVVGNGVDPTRVGQRVWVYGAQSYRPFGTGAQFTTGAWASPASPPTGQSSVTAQLGRCTEKQRVRILGLHALEESPRPASQRRFWHVAVIPLQMVTQKAGQP
jgi:hypothetical protein